MKKFVALSILASLLFGCAELEQATKKIGNTLGLDLTPEQTSTIEGSLTAGAIGALAGQLIGKDTESTVIGAGAGLLIGGIAANWYAKKVVARSDELKNKEDDLDSRIQYAKNINGDAVEYNNNLKREVAEAKKKAEEIKAMQVANEIRESELNTERQILAKKIETAKSNEKLLQAQLDELSKFRQSSNEQSSQLDIQIAQLKNNLVEVKTNTRQLSELYY